MSPTTGSLIDFTRPLGPGPMYGRDEGQAQLVTPLSVYVYLYNKTRYIYIVHDGHLTLSYMPNANTYLYMLRNSIQNFFNNRARVRFSVRVRVPPGTRYPEFSGIRVSTRLCPISAKM